MAKKPTKNEAEKVASAANVRVKIERLPHGEDLPLPAYQTELAAGLDLVAALPWDSPLTLLPGSRTLVPTGLKIALPPGYEAQVRPRSGLAVANGVTVLNSPGTIDADYRGEVAVILANLGGAPFEIRRGERIAQLVVAPIVQAQLIEVDALDETARGEGGFGSTGKAAAAKQPSAKKAGAAVSKPAAKKISPKKEVAKKPAKKPAAKAAKAPAKPSKKTPKKPRK